MDTKDVKKEDTAAATAVPDVKKEDAAAATDVKKEEDPYKHEYPSCKLHYWAFLFGGQVFLTIPNEGQKFTSGFGGFGVGGGTSFGTVKSKKPIKEYLGKDAKFHSYGLTVGGGFIRIVIGEEDDVIFTGFSAGVLALAYAGGAGTWVEMPKEEVVVEKKEEVVEKKEKVDEKKEKVDEKKEEVAKKTEEVTQDKK